VGEFASGSGEELIERDIQGLVAADPSYHHFSFLQKGCFSFSGVAGRAVVSVSKYLFFASRSAARPASISFWDHIPAHRTLPPRMQ